MSVTISVADNGNGSATATIAGSGGASNSLYYAVWSGVAGSLPAYTLAGTITGDGTINASPGYGYYVWELVSNGAVQSLVYQPLIDLTATAQHMQVLNGVATVIQTLALPGIGSNIKVCWTPRAFDATGIPLEQPPFCYIAPIGAEDIKGMVISQDDYGYPACIVLCDKLQGDIFANMNRDLLWRQKANRALIRQRLAGTNAWTCQPLPEAIVDLGAFKKNWLVSIMVYRFYVRLTRGLT